MTDRVRVNGYPLFYRDAVVGTHRNTGNEIAFLRALMSKLRTMECFTSIYPSSHPAPHDALLVVDDGDAAIDRESVHVVSEMVGIVCSFIDELVQNGGLRPELANAIFREYLVVLGLSFTMTGDTDVECHDTRISLSSTRITLRENVSVESFRAHVDGLRGFCTQALADAKAAFSVDRYDLNKGGGSYSESGETISGAAAVVVIASMLCSSFSPMHCGIVELYNMCHPKDVVNQYESDVADLQSKIDSLLVENNGLKVQLAELKTEVNALTEKADRLGGEKEALMCERAEYEARVESERTAWNTEKSSLNSHIATLETELSTGKDAIDALRADNARLQAENTIYYSLRVSANTQVREASARHRTIDTQRGIVPRMKLGAAVGTSLLPGSDKQNAKDPIRSSTTNIHRPFFSTKGSTPAAKD